MHWKAEGRRYGWETELERCVVCGAETPYRQSMPVGLRADYIEGSGQLCCRCAEEVRREERRTRQHGYADALPHDLTLPTSKVAEALRHVW